MSVHFEIHEVFGGKSFVLVNSVYPKSFEPIGGRTPRKFPTRGGARNYIHKYQLGRVRIVRVQEQRP